MKIHAHKFGIAAAVSMGFWYVICALAFFLWHDQALQFTAAIFHMTSLGPLVPYFQVTVANASSGLIQSMLYTYLFTAVMGAVYNWLVCPKK